jgi:hypothetical protein
MSTAVSLGQAAAWESKLHQEVPLLGHRNWIVIADSAYPLQVSPGIETLYVEGNQLEVLGKVLEELSKSKHVRPFIYTDAELKHVSEKRAPGITAYREGLASLLATHKPHALSHEEIIAKLDAAGKTFKVLVLKTPLTLPYTSVFLELDCAYWDAAAEKELRAAITSGSK